MYPSSSSTLPPCTTPNNNNNNHIEYANKDRNIFSSPLWLKSFPRPFPSLPFPPSRQLQYSRAVELATESKQQQAVVVVWDIATQPKKRFLSSSLPSIIPYSSSTGKQELHSLSPSLQRDCVPCLSPSLLRPLTVRRTVADDSMFYVLQPWWWCSRQDERGAHVPMPVSECECECGCGELRGAVGLVSVRE